MRKPFLFITVTASLLLSAIGVFAQADQRVPAEPSFEVTLSVVTGTSDPAQKSDLPQNLSGIAKQIRSSFGLTNLKLSDSYIGRIGNNGTISYKSVAAIDGRPQTDTPSFLDWHIAGLKNTAAAGGANAFSILQFNFGARVPVAIGGSSPVQYEAIGLSVDRMTVPENSPVLIGTIALPKADGGRVFLVLNVSPASN